MISMMRPKESWVAKFNGQKVVDTEGGVITRVPGLYAIKVINGDEDLETIPNTQKKYKRKEEQYSDDEGQYSVGSDWN